MNVCLGKRFMSIIDPLEIPLPPEKREKEEGGGRKKEGGIYIYKYKERENIPFSHNIVDKEKREEDPEGIIILLFLEVEYKILLIFIYYS